jgi:hypothetical protein
MTRLRPRRRKGERPTIEEMEGPVRLSLGSGRSIRSSTFMMMMIFKDDYEWWVTRDVKYSDCGLCLLQRTEGKSLEISVTIEHIHVYNQSPHHASKELNWRRSSFVEKKNSKYKYGPSDEMTATFLLHLSLRFMLLLKNWKAINR